MDIRETEVAIKLIKDYFERALAQQLNLTRVSAPLFVRPETGLNDDLCGWERQIKFDLRCGRQAVIVQSLAKWKRMALHKYGFGPGEGIYTDMNAIRRDETLSPIHSYYVDQWDWEKVITKDERNLKTLECVVRKIYDALLQTEQHVCDKYPHLKKKLPDQITILSSQTLEDEFEGTAQERERLACKKYGAIFLTQIGKPLKSGQPHDGRAPDYDDWDLNGDIIVYYEPLDIGLELSSMGIRVDPTSLQIQLKMAGQESRKELEFHKLLLAGHLPLSIGGGIGQSRLCMFFLEKSHIGEVQASIWTDEILQECKKKHVYLL